MCQVWLTRCSGIVFVLCAGHPCIKNGAPASAVGAERWGAVLCVRRNRGWVLFRHEFEGVGGDEQFFVGRDDGDGHGAVESRDDGFGAVDAAVFLFVEFDA